MLSHCVVVRSFFLRLKAIMYLFLFNIIFLHSCSCLTTYLSKLKLSFYWSPCDEYCLRVQIHQSVFRNASRNQPTAWFISERWGSVTMWLNPALWLCRNGDIQRASCWFLFLHDKIRCSMTSCVICFQYICSNPSWQTWKKMTWAWILALSLDLSPSSGTKNKLHAQLN